ncbi:PREDICTED: immunoglobulin superfamily member 2-like [Gavialis gangeticus]|uniref:immunoglobulin superfamily member 2-like n=1 Tax=Gavialis gangeticus TaxID=94835 RepID=UPI00092F1FCA|nr:PREDICTED: immunoglobulin superfamily member 2-like [Gavialis gangeticus]
MGSVQYSVPLLFLILGLCFSQRVVTVQKGPLYRVRGYNITIACNVSGYQGPSEQNFQWYIYLPSAPKQEIQIISTKDPSFFYAMYAQRVRSKEIYVERLQGDSVLLHITELQDRDAGEYECHTPNTDERHFGNYSAKMHLSVIPDTLSASMKPQTLDQMEGDPLELTCEVSKSTAQHTHLSVGWYQIAGDGQVMEILSLSKDFVLSPGSSYRPRFLTGDVQLGKIGDTTYKLSISRVRPSDQGRLYCEAVEWIQDPDKTWKDISRKQTEQTLLTVTSLERDFHVSAAASESSLAEGMPLQLNCLVNAQNSKNRWFQVIWLFKGVEVASIDPNGVLVLKNEYEERARLGQLQLVKKSSEMYVFNIYQVGLKDKGTYSCKVSEMEKTPTVFLTIRSKLSPGTDVNVKPIESNLQVSVFSNAKQIWEGDTLILRCEVSGAKYPLSVNWWHLRKSGDQAELVAGMDQDGKLSLGPSFQEHSAQGDLRLERKGPTTFILAIYKILAISDGGPYKCEVTEWHTDRSWKQAQETSVVVNPLNLTAVLTARTADIKLTQDFELFCTVSVADKAPVSVTWQFLPTTEKGSYQQLVKLMPDGAIKWGTTTLHLQKKTKLSKSTSSFQLVIHSAMEQDEGRYRCDAEVWRKSSFPAGLPAAAVMSNAVAIKVNPPESKLKLDTQKKSLEISGSTAAEIECRVLSQTQRDSQLTVAWYFLQPPPADAAPLRIMRTNLSNIVDYGTEFSSPLQKSRFYSERVSNDLFKLHILSVNHGDHGRYYCVVEEWLWLAGSGWYKFGEKESEKTTLEFKLSENKLHVEKTNHTISSIENEDVTMNCIVQSSDEQASLLSVVWFYKSKHSGRKPLVKVHHKGMVDIVQKNMAGRLQFLRPSSGDFSLVMRNVELSDSGVYYCQVEEWVYKNSNGAWVQQASELSGYTSLTALSPDANLQVHARDSAVVLQEGWEKDVHLDCNFTSKLNSSSSTTFSVRWWRVTGAGREELFSISHSSVFQYGPAINSSVRTRLRFERPGELQYRLMLLKPEVSDSGDYYCHVELWMLGPRRVWYKRSERHSGNNTVLILPSESTVSSRICSSPSLLHFILSLPLILFLILTAALLYLYVKFRQTNKAPIRSKEERSLWVEMETPEDAMPVYSSHNNKCSNNQREEELSKLKEDEME